MRTAAGAVPLTCDHPITMSARQQETQGHREANPRHWDTALFHAYLSFLVGDLNGTWALGN